MELDVIKQAFVVFVMAVGVVALPFAVKYVLDFVQAYIQIGREKLKEYNPHIYDVAMFFARQGVRLAEQKGKEFTNSEKFDMALAYLQRELDDRGLGGIDVEVLADKIEIAVFEELNEWKVELDAPLG